MDIRSKEELRSVIRYERELWKARMYPQGASSKVRNITLVYMKALRKVEYYGKLSKMRKILGGGTSFGKLYTVCLALLQMFLFPHMYLGRVC